MNWNTYLTDLNTTLDAIQATDRDGNKLNVDEAYRLLAEWVGACVGDRCRVYFVGNGASASMACHFSTDLAKNSGAPTEVFTDPSLITATGNDMGYDETFAYPLRQRMTQGEILIAISSSGNSPNTVKAVTTAQELGGRAVTFTAMKPDNAMRNNGDLNFYIPATTYGMAESAHAVMLHHLIDYFTD